jgi:RNA polymerase sigma-70 factor, ECF subfamily
VDEMDYEQVVASFYEGLYGFAYSLARNKDDACELAQETFARLLAKGGDVRDRSKIKSWLFTTLYRIYVGWKRREARLPHLEIASVEHELPSVTAEMVDQLENEAVLQSLLEMEEHHRVPLMLFYLENHSYREIAELLDISIGTVMSRLSRAKALLRVALASHSIGADRKIISINQDSRRKKV